MVEKTGSGEQQLIVVPDLLDNSLGPRLEGERRVVRTGRCHVEVKDQIAPCSQAAATSHLCNAQA